MTAELLPHFKTDVEELVLVPAGGGRFEVFADDQLIYSKLETGRFPENREIIEAIERKMRS